jgi:hypothetical protein
MFIGELEKAVEQIKAEKEEEEPPADAPEEFLDALLYTVMKDPVQLPRCVGWSVACGGEGGGLCEEGGGARDHAVTPSAPGDNAAHTLSLST